MKKRNDPSYPLLSVINKLTLTFNEFGDFLEQQEIKYRFGRNCQTKPNDDQKSLDMENMRGTTYLYGAGVVGGVCLLIIEFVLRRCLRAPQRLRRPHMATRPPRTSVRHVVVHWRKHLLLRYHKRKRNAALELHANNYDQRTKSYHLSD
jgi:hypothetical protein